MCPADTLSGLLTHGGPWVPAVPLLGYSQPAGLAELRDLGLWLWELGAAIWSASKWLQILVSGLNPPSRAWGEYKTHSDLSHLWGKCEEKVKFHFKSGARAWGESLVKWYRKGHARELQHLLGSREHHNSSCYQQEAAPQPLQGWASPPHSRASWEQRPPFSCSGCESAGLWGLSPAPSQPSSLRCLHRFAGLSCADAVYCAKHRRAFVHKYSDRFLCMHSYVRV